MSNRSDTPVSTDENAIIPSANTLPHFTAYLTDLNGVGGYVVYEIQGCTGYNRIPIPPGYRSSAQFITCCGGFSFYSAHLMHFTRDESAIPVNPFSSAPPQRAVYPCVCP